MSFVGAADDCLKRDRDVVMAAVKGHGNALRWVEPTTSSNVTETSFQLQWRPMGMYSCTRTTVSNVTEASSL